MKIHRGVGAARREGAAVVTVGSFDGVHLGHRALVRRTAEVARELGAAATVVTFEPHPRRFFDPAARLDLLTLPDERVAVLEQLEVDDLVVLEFDQRLADLDPAGFMDELGRFAEVAAVVAGHDFAFGKGRAGDLGWLRAQGFRVEEVGAVEVDGRPVHSTAIRGLVASGAVAEAAVLLGRRHSAHGTVVPGHRRGRELGFPTANLDVSPDKAVPAPAAYAGRARTAAGTAHRAAISVTHRPTFGGTERSVEAHLLDFDGDLYGQDLAIEFVDMLHPDLRYESVDALVEQIRADVARTRELVP